ncbi:MAG: hypothetical protein ACKOXB_04645 [Flavobacteriales bacterium]
MKLKKVFFSIFFFSFLIVSAQDANSFFSSLIRSRGYTYIYTNGSITNPSPTGDFCLGTSLFGFEYGLRKNIKDLDANNAISVGLYPSVHASYFVGNVLGFGSISIPLLVEYNHGNVSSWEADMDKGFVLGLGLDFRVAPLFVRTYDLASTDIRRAYLQGLGKVGYRYWGRDNKPREISLRIGAGFVSQDISEEDYFFSSARSLSAELYWTKYLNY